MEYNQEQANRDQAYVEALKDWLYQLADDELTLGHRDSEWLGLCPDIEGDVAFSSVAQDEVGHAVFYFDLLHELGEDDPDTLAFNRAITKRKNAILLERENQDWAYSVVRHYFYDLFDKVRLEAMQNSSYLPLRRGVEKIRREEYFHLMHMQLWFSRLAQAGGEAKERVEQAIVKVWADLSDLFEMGAFEKELVQFQIVDANSAELKERWLKIIQPIFTELKLEWPGELPSPVQSGRTGDHSEQLDSLLDTMTEVYRLDPLTRW